ncbi:hypothetical protein ACOZB2_25120 [Pantoea endophytica]|uniref:Uncharacterized protein n=1 Tax=Pantoea sp. BJ2 TaxID=3141322 RepID=A0AAU7U3N6_9GAMM
MIILLSGEGPTDLGTCVNGQGLCRVPDFQYGPMTLLVDKELEAHNYYSPLETSDESYIFISKPRLTDLMDEKSGRNVAFRGKKQTTRDRGYFFDNAWMLGEEALRLATEHDSPVIAVLFRDCDGNNQSGQQLWQTKIQSIRDGFERSGLCERGIAMVPRPKSEAWLLCAIRNNYQHCARLEDTLPGNDDAPNSAKQQLDEAMGNASSRLEQVLWINENGFDGAAVAGEMESYRSFSLDMQRALRSL